MARFNNFALAHRVHRRPPMLASADTFTFLDLSCRDVDIPLLHDHARRVDFAVGRLCDALGEPDGVDVHALAFHAHHAVLDLAAELEPADSDNDSTRQKLEYARAAVAALLEELDRLVEEQMTRRV
ncbi:MAG: hypothetical protein WKG01_14055 [Kofleriaceae bacterium]